MSVVPSIYLHLRKLDPSLRRKKLLEKLQIKKQTKKKEIF